MDFRSLLTALVEVRAADLASNGHHLLMTDHGLLDLLGTVIGDRSFEDLVERSEVVELADGCAVRVLDLDAIVEMEETMGRDKDLAQLPLLRQVLAERRHPPSQ